MVLYYFPVNSLIVLSALSRKITVPYSTTASALVVKDRALEVLGTLQGNEEEGPMMGEYIGLIEARGYNALAN